MIARRAVPWLYALFAMLLAATGAAVAPDPASAQAERKTPYWAAIAEEEALMRVGPSTDYPASWLYRRRNLPVKVIETYPNWRKVEDPDGTQGWMHKRLLKAEATAIVVREVAPLRGGRDAGAPVLYRAEPGVVGRVSDCKDGWCAFDVNGQRGFVEARQLWGAVEGE